VVDEPQEHPLQRYMPFLIIYYYFVYFNLFFFTLEFLMIGQPEVEKALISHLNTSSCTLMYNSSVEGLEEDEACVTARLY
jgi:hypothetical protein